MRHLLVCLAILASGCEDQSMTKQPRYGWQAPAPMFANGAAALTPPEGTIAQGSGPTDPPKVDAALMQRGRQRFEIFCAPCHGFTGDGDGVIVRRGFPHPPSFDDAPLREASAQRYFDAITNGYGVMYSYAARVPAHDRWAIIAYVRALQKSRATTLAEAPEATAKLGARRRELHASEPIVAVRRWDRLPRSIGAGLAICSRRSRAGLADRLRVLEFDAHRRHGAAIDPRLDGRTVGTSGARLRSPSSRQLVCCFRWHSWRC